MTITERPHLGPPHLPPTGPPHRTVITRDTVSPAQKPYGDTYRTSIVTIREYDYRGNLVDLDAARAAFAADGDTEGAVEYLDDRQQRLIRDVVTEVCGHGAQFDRETAERLNANRWFAAQVCEVQHSNMDSHFGGWWGDLKVIGDYTVSITHTSPNCE